MRPMHAWSLRGTMKLSLPRDAAPRPDGERFAYQVVHGGPLPAVVFFGVYLAYTPRRVVCAHGSGWQHNVLKVLNERKHSSLISSRTPVVTLQRSKGRRIVWHCALLCRAWQRLGTLPARAGPGGAQAGSAGHGAAARDAVRSRARAHQGPGLPQAIRATKSAVNTPRTGPDS